MPKAIIFDLEGVIIDTENTVWDQAATIFLVNHGKVYNREKTKHLLMGRNLQEGIAILKKQYGFSGDNQKLVQERRAIVKRLFGQNVNFMPGFMNFYQSVVDKFSLAIATSLERPLLTLVDKRLNLSKLFGGHVYSIADVNYIGKPSPDVFLYAAKKLGVAPNECLVIEDSPNGIEAAKKAGMYSVGITNTVDAQKLQGADLVVNTYSDIKLTNF